MGPCQAHVDGPIRLKFAGVEGLKAAQRGATKPQSTCVERPVR